MKYLKIVLLFIGVYAITLPLYFSIAQLYNESIIKTSTYLTCFKYNLHVKQVDVNGSTVMFVLENDDVIKDFYGDRINFEFDLELNGKSIFFNTPLTLALLFSIVFTFKRKFSIQIRAIVIGMFSLIALHVTTFLVMNMAVFASIITQTSGLASNYLNDYYLPYDFLQHLATFLNSYAVYFEPFLIGLLTYVTLLSKNNK